LENANEIVKAQLPDDGELLNQPVKKSAENLLAEQNCNDAPSPVRDEMFIERG